MDVGDVCRKRREVLLDRLVVADVGQHGVEYREFGAIGGNWDTGLRHQREQANSLERNRLAAGVRTRNHELALFAGELNADRHDVCTLCFEIALEQRVSSFEEK